MLRKQTDKPRKCMTNSVNPLTFSTLNLLSFRTFIILQHYYYGRLYVIRRQRKSSTFYYIYVQ